MLRSRFTRLVSAATAVAARSAPLRSAAQAGSSFVILRRLYAAAAT